MYETFEKLPESRRKHILEICIEEFAHNGYQNTSTNTIVKRLGISKGLLFLYFKSKKDLYLYLADYLAEVTVDYFFQTSEYDETKGSIDIFDNLGGYYKELLQEKPDYMMFMLEAFLGTPVDLRAEVENRHGKAHDHIMEHLNTDGFRKNVDLQAAVNLIHLTTFHIGQMIFKDPIEIGDIKKGVDTYLEMFTKCMDIIKHGVYEK